MSLADLQNMFLNPDLLERYGPRFIDGLLVTGKLWRFPSPSAPCWAC